MKPIVLKHNENESIYVFNANTIVIEEFNTNTKVSSSQASIFTPTSFEGITSLLDANTHLFLNKTDNKRIAVPIELVIFTQFYANSIGVSIGLGHTTIIVKESLETILSMIADTNRTIDY